MTNPTYTNPFTGQTVSPSSTSYESLTINADTTLQWSINGNNQNQVTANIIEVTNTNTNIVNLIMPPATQVAQGQAMIIRNIGTYSFTVVQYNTSAPYPTIITIPSGLSYYIYVTNNTTTAGTWNYVLFGGSTASTSASALAGYGLVAINTTLNQQYLVSTFSSNTTLTSNARAQMNVWTGGAGTVNLPSASSVGANWFTIIKNDGAGILTIIPNGTDTIDGNSNQQLQLTESIVLVSYGSGGWYTFGYGRSNQFAYTELALSLTGGTTVLTSAQAQNTIQIYTGSLTSNAIIVVPQTVQLYTVTNNTTGSYTLTVKTSAGGGATVSVAQSTSLVLICDGTNVYNAASGSTSSITSLTLGNGSTSVPSLKFVGDANTGLFLPSSGQLGIVVSNVQQAYFSSSGLNVTGAGAFTGAVSGTTGTFTSGIYAGAF
jgi:hypothetical protein